MSEPEIIPPGQTPRDRRRAGAVLDDRLLQLLASLLDDAFQIPGTSFRFGLDPIVGLVPGVGDFITSIASFLIVLAAWQRRLPKITIVRMIANIAIDTLVGTIPIAGDAFDAAWKSNKMNLALLQRGQTESGRQSWRDWLFLLGIALVFGILLAIPLVVLAVVIHLLRH